MLYQPFRLGSFGRRKESMENVGLGWSSTLAEPQRLGYAGGSAVRGTPNIAMRS